jgi:drug/metabolite transporter (DMT)-like permease
MTATWRAVAYVVGLQAGIAAMLAGLFALEVHPIAGTLITLAAMALLLSSLSELCQARGLNEPNLRETKKENVYGG